MGRRIKVVNVIFIFAILLFSTVGLADAARSSRAPRLKDFQEGMQYLGYYAGKVDGTMNSETKEALAAFQQKNNLEITGQMNVETWKKIRDEVDGKMREEEGINN